MYFAQTSDNFCKRTENNSSAAWRKFPEKVGNSNIRSAFFTSPTIYCLESRASKLAYFFCVLIGFTFRGGVGGEGEKERERGRERDEPENSSVIGMHRSLSRTDEKANKIFACALPPAREYSVLQRQPASSILF